MKSIAPCSGNPTTTESDGRFLPSDARPYDCMSDPCKTARVAGLRSERSRRCDWRDMERVMGIEYIAGLRLLTANQTVATKVLCCV